MPSAFKILYLLDEAIDLSSLKSIWNRNRLEVSLWLRLDLEGLIWGKMNPCRVYSQNYFHKVSFTNLWNDLLIDCKLFS